MFQLSDPLRLPSRFVAAPDLIVPAPPHPSRRYDSDDVPHAFAAAPTRSPGGSAASSRRSSRRGSRSSHVGSLESLYDTFLAYCNYGVRGVGEDAMDGAKWAKFCRETGLQNRRTLDATKVDLIFSKVKTRGERKITFEEFKDAVAMVAEMRGRTFADTCLLVVSKGGPQSSGTRAEYVKFAEPSNFTGASAANFGFDAKARHKADEMWKLKMPAPEVSDDLRRVFAEFCAFGGGNPGFMEGKTFIKLLRDCGLIDGKVRDAAGRRFSQTSADLIFTKVRPKGERVVEIEDFALALRLVADEIGATYEYVHDFVVTVDGPSNTGTKAEYNKFYDDKESYTGAYAAQFGVEKPLRKHEEWRSSHAPAPPPDVPGLKSVFNAFCTFGGGAPGAMDNVKFVKCCRDSRLIGRKFTTTAADLCFTKVKKKGERRISYVEFRWACDQIASASGRTYEQVTEMMLRGGPSSSGTHAEYTKFYDDKSTYTGAYAAVHHVPKVRKQRVHWKDGRPPPNDECAPGLRETYEAFCSFGGGNGEDMNIKLWAKLVNETGLVGRRFNMTSADIIFSKVAEGRKLLEYEDFLYMLDLAAEEKRTDFETVARAVAECDPSSSGTKALYNKFYDDKSTFTGAYAARFGIEARVADRKHWKEGRPRPECVDGMEEVFDAYCTAEGGRAGSMGIATWEKVCEDAGLFVGGDFEPSDADAIFAKVCGNAAGHVLDRAVNYVDFKWALDLAAEKKGVSYRALCESILDGEGLGGGKNPYY